MLRIYTYLKTLMYGYIALHLSNRPDTVNDLNELFYFVF